MLFFAGSNRKRALEIGHQYFLKNKYPIINYAVENTHQSRSVIEEYQQLLHQIPHHHFSLALKLSSFDFDIQHVSTIISLAQQKNIKVFIDAEQGHYNSLYQDLTSQLMYNFNGEKPCIFKTYQLYRADSLQYLSRDLNYCSQNNLYLGAKLVRGAYWNSEKDTGDLFLNKKDTDDNYNRAILHTFQHPYSHQKIVLATHNKLSSEFGQLLSSNKDIYEFAHLQGMRERYYQELSEKYPVYVYLPYGPFSEMLPYLGRRLYENMSILKTIF